MGNFSAKYTVNMNEYNTETGISPLNSSLAFTKDFADIQKPIYNWTPRSSNALNEFISGNLAFYIGYASEAAYIKALIKNYILTTAFCHKFLVVKSQQHMENCMLYLC